MLKREQILAMPGDANQKILSSKIVDDTTVALILNRQRNELIDSHLEALDLIDRLENALNEQVHSITNAWIKYQKVKSHIYSYDELMLIKNSPKAFNFFETNQLLADLIDSHLELHEQMAIATGKIIQMKEYIEAVIKEMRDDTST